MSMRDALIKTKKRYEALKHVDARTMMLQDIIPLLAKIDEKLDGEMSNVNENFVDIFATLNIVDEVGFLDATGVYFMEMGQLIDMLMVAAGFFKDNGDGTFAVNPETPEEIQVAIANIQKKSSDWQNKFVAMREAAELDDDDDFDDEDGDDFDDEDGLEVEGDVEADEPAMEVESEPEVDAVVAAEAAESEVTEEAANA